MSYKVDRIKTNHYFSNLSHSFQIKYVFCSYRNKISRNQKAVKYSHFKLNLLYSPLKSISIKIFPHTRSTIAVQEKNEHRVLTVLWLTSPAPRSALQSLEQGLKQARLRMLCFLNFLFQPFGVYSAARWNVKYEHLKHPTLYYILFAQKLGDWSCFILGVKTLELENIKVLRKSNFFAIFAVGAKHGESGANFAYNENKT